jgi:hypothetical protein
MSMVLEAVILLIILRESGGRIGGVLARILLFENRLSINKIDRLENFAFDNICFQEF